LKVAVRLVALKLLTALTYSKASRSSKQEDDGMNGKVISVIMLNVCIFLLASAVAAVQLPGPLVDTEWLATNMDKDKIVVLDVRRESDVSKHGFIPRSRLWKWDNVRVDRVINGVALESMVPTSEQFETIMRDLGINNDTPVVIVPMSSDTSSLTMGTRAFWTFKYFGHDNVALLDGGTSKWIDEKREVSTLSAEAKEAGNLKVKSQNDDIAASTEEVTAASGNKKVQLIDGRTPDFYLGEKKKEYVYAKGHIPGARNFPPALLIDPSTNAFKPVSELRQLLSDNGVDVNKAVITYCDSGHLSTGIWFVLHELIGNKNVKLYDGSMHEWTKDDKRPVTMKEE